MLSVCRIRAPWVWITPLGLAVDPEVWMITSRSAGVTRASTASRQRSSALSARASSAATDQPASRPAGAGPLNQIRRSHGAVSERSGGGRDHRGGGRSS
jgi:hypothetical protein